MKPYLFKFALFFLFIFTACVSEDKIVFQETEITTEDNTIVSVNIPKAIGEQQIADNINGVVSASISKSLNFDNPNHVSDKTVEEEISIFNTEFKAFKNDFPDSAQVWEAQIDGDVMYQSPEIISIALTSYMNTGGAHGILTIDVLNFDAQTGKQILNTDLFNNTDEVSKIAKSYYVNFIKENDITPFEAETFKLPENIGFEKEGVLFFYNVYEVASYASGTIDFTIPYAEISSYLNYY